MVQARLVLAGLILAGAALAACSGNFGSATTQPGQVIPSGPINPPTATPSPSSGSGIVTYGESDALQPLPQVGGYGGAIAFAVPSPRPSGFDNIPVGVTLSVNSPSDAPDLNAEVSHGHRTKQRQRPARALVYLTLLPTRDITLSSYPRIAIDVPRDIVVLYHENELGLAYYNSAEKAKTYRLSVAALESSETAPSPGPLPSGSAPVGSAAPATPSPTPSLTPTPSPSPGLPGQPGRPTPATSATPTASPTLPPQRITFAAAPGPITLVANKPAVFALYALPVAASPAPSSLPTRLGSRPTAAASPLASGALPASGSPSASSSPEEFGSAAPLSTSTVAAPSAPSAPNAPAAPALTTAPPH